MQVAMMTLTFQLSAIPKVDLAEPKGITSDDIITYRKPLCPQLQSYIIL